MLARYMLSTCVRLSVCQTVTSRYCIETTKRIELVFGMGAFFAYPTCVEALRCVLSLQ